MKTQSWLDWIWSLASRGWGPEVLAMGDRGAKRGLPRYVQRPHEPHLDPPFILGKAGSNCCYESHVFVIEVDVKALKALCESQLNDPLEAMGFEREFSVMGTTRLMITLNTYKATSEQSSGPGSPSLPYSEVCFMFMVKRDADRAYWFLPIVYIGPYGNTAGSLGDDASVYPIILGREIYGFPKAPARIEYAQDQHHNVQVGTLRVLDVGVNGDIALHEVLDVRPIDEPFDTAGLEWDSDGEAERALLASALGKTPDEIGWSTEGKDDLIATMDGQSIRFDTSLSYDLPLLTLKQIRNPRYPDRASYQALVATTLKVKGDSFHWKTTRDHELWFKDPDATFLQIWDALGIRRISGLPNGYRWCRKVDRDGSACSFRSWLLFGEAEETEVWQPGP